MNKISSLAFSGKGKGKSKGKKIKKGKKHKKGAGAPPAPLPNQVPTYDPNALPFVAALPLRAAAAPVPAPPMFSDVKHDEMDGSNGSNSNENKENNNSIISINSIKNLYSIYDESKMEKYRPKE